MTHTKRPTKLNTNQPGSILFLMPATLHATPCDTPTQTPSHTHMGHLVYKLMGGISSRAQPKLEGDTAATSEFSCAVDWWRFVLSSGSEFLGTFRNYGRYAVSV